jgi:two-component system, LytTR family, response regulator
VNITCLIVEDEPLARNLLVDYVKKVPSLQLVDACSNAMDAMDALRKNPVDLLFLDIQMPEITGITFLKVLQKKPLVIFTTAYSQYALEGYELDVVDYLLKPITLERFLKAVDKAVVRLQGMNQATTPAIAGPDKPEFVFVKDGTKMVKVKLNDILYIEGMKDYVTIHTRDKKITTLQRMKTLEEQLPADQFIRIHHSYIIALHAIDAVHKSDVQIGQALLPISDSYKKAFREYIEKNHMQ